MSDHHKALMLMTEAASALEPRPQEAGDDFTELDSGPLPHLSGFCGTSIVRAKQNPSCDKPRKLQTKRSKYQCFDLVKIICRLWPSY